MKPLVENKKLRLSPSRRSTASSRTTGSGIHKEAQLGSTCAGRSTDRVDNTDTGTFSGPSTSVSSSSSAVRRLVKLSQWGGDLIDWLKNGPIVEADIAGFPELLAALREDIDKRYVIDVLDVDDEERAADVRLVERRTGLAANLRIPFAALSGREFQALKKVHARVRELVETTTSRSASTAWPRHSMRSACRSSSKEGISCSAGASAG